MVMLLLSQIAKDDIKNFKSGRTLPACTIQVEWIGSGEPKQLCHKVNIIGAQKPNNYFYMRYSPQECEFVCAYIASVYVCVVTMHVYIVIIIFCCLYFQTNLLLNPPAKR